VDSSAAGRQRHYDDPSSSSACPGASGGFPQRATLTQWAEPRRQARQKQGLRLLRRPQENAAFTG